MQREARCGSEKSPWGGLALATCLHSLKQGVCAGNMNRRHSFWCPVLAGYGRLQKEWSGVHVLTDEPSDAGPELLVWSVGASGLCMDFDKR